MQPARPCQAKRSQSLAGRSEHDDASAICVVVHDGIDGCASYGCAQHIGRQHSARHDCNGWAAGTCGNYDDPAHSNEKTGAGYGPHRHCDDPRQDSTAANFSAADHRYLVAACGCHCTNHPGTKAGVVGASIGRNIGQAKTNCGCHGRCAFATGT
jgi:hypothetical protein